MNKTTSLELSKRMRDLGAVQESTFWWEEVIMPYDSFAELVSKKSKGSAKMRHYSAFDSSELGEMLPEKVCWRFTNINGKWIMAFGDKKIEADTMAEAMGEMYCYLKENKLI